MFWLLLACATHPVDVHHAGELRKIMHKGDLSAHISLSDLQNNENLYALGAIEGLDGEIVVWNSELFLSQERDSKVIISDNQDTSASLLVYAQVKKWKRIPVPASVHSTERLETFLVEQATEIGIDSSKPFPFQLKGSIQELDWHVIHWAPNQTKHSHQAHVESGAFGTLTDQDVEIIGFHSLSHKGVWTHHTRNVHMHFLNADKELSGHVDRLHMQTMELYLPLK